MSNGHSPWFARFFFDFRRKISKDFAQLFDGTGEEDTKGVNMHTKWGWYNILYSLSNENILNIEKITKLPVLEVLTYLAYSQDNNNTKNNNYDRD